jgi:hypothetical protein
MDFQKRPEVYRETPRYGLLARLVGYFLDPDRWEVLTSIGLKSRSTTDAGRTTKPSDFGETTRRFYI